MKLYLPTAALSFLFIGCSAVDLLQQPFDSDSSALDSPLDAGKKETFSSLNNSSNTASDSSAERFPPGTKIETTFPNATLYNKIPKFGSWPSKTTIPAGAEGRVISYNGDYAEVELDDYSRGYIKSQYIVESFEEVVTPPKPKTSSTLPLPDQLEVAPDLPDLPETKIEPESAPVSEEVIVKQRSLSGGEDLYQLSDEEIMQRIRERKEALLQQKEAEQKANSTPAVEPASATIPSVIEDAVKEEITVPALDAPDAKIDIPQLD